MKTVKMMSLLAALFMLLPAFVSCDKDDDDEKLSVANIIGTYSGTLDAKVMNIDCDMPGQYNVTIQKEPKEKDEVQVVISETSFKYPGSEKVSTIPSITIPEVDVKSSGNGYVISEDDYSVILNNVTYTGSIEGKISGRTAEIAYTVKPGAMPMDISYTFKGVLK